MIAGAKLAKKPAANKSWKAKKKLVQKAAKKVFEKTAAKKPVSKKTAKPAAK